MMALAAVAQPQVTWLERQHDFGVIKESDGKVKCRLRVVNTGNEPLSIIKVQVGCGCTAVDYPESPIAPGDTAVVALTYNPSGRPGQFSKQAIVFTNTVPKRVILEITGNVIPTDETLDKDYPLRAGGLRISQSSMPFGEMTRGKNSTLFLSTYNSSTDTLVVRVKGGKPHISAALVPDTVPPARVSALTVHYLSGHAPLWGLNVDTLTLECEPLGKPAATAATATIGVMAQVLEDFGLLTDDQRHDAPVVDVDCGDRLDYGTIAAGDVVTRQFAVTNRGKNTLAIRRLWVPQGEGVTVSVNRQEVKRGKTATVSVTVDASRIEGQLLNVPLTLLCNDPVTPRLTVRLVGLIDKKNNN